MPDNENKLVNIEPETREETFLQDIADGTETLTPATRKEEFLRRIAAKPGLPSVTESDEGKILTVESGEAVWGEGGGGGVSVYRPLSFEDFPLPEGGVCAELEPVFHYTIPSVGLETSTTCMILMEGPGDFSPTFLATSPVSSGEPLFLEPYGVVDIKKASAAGLLPPFAPLSDDPTAGNIYMLTAKSADDIEFAAAIYEAGTGFTSDSIFILIKNVDPLVWVRHQPEN